MSAWIVNRKHIDVLVAGVLEQGGFRHHSKYITVVSDGFEYMGKNECMEASELGKMLWRENHKSINYRYALRDRTPSYTYRAPQEFQTAKNDWYPDRPLVDRALLAKQISCYDYQTCEHPTYYRSRAYSVVQSMSNALLHHVEGYEDAPWGVE